MDTLLLTRSEVRQLIKMDEFIEAVEEGFVSYSSRQTIQPQVVSIDIPTYGGEIDIKSSYSLDNELISVKTASGYWDNQKYTLPSLLADLTLYDGKTGYPVCMMNAGDITGYRTAAAGAVSCKYLANQSSEILTIIGAGVQAELNILSVVTVMDIKKVKIYSRHIEKSRILRDKLKYLNIEINSYESVEEACKDADIIVTTTPSTKAILLKEHIKKGVHIVAIGCDMAGKQEVDQNIFSDALIVTDSIEQCMTRGETRNAIVNGIIKGDSISGDIGDLIMNKFVGRRSENQITIFDSTGMGIQDNVVAKLIYDKALNMNIGSKIDFLS